MVVKPFAHRLNEVVDAVVQQRIRVMIDRDLPLTGFADAWAHQKSGHAHGKIVVRPE